MLTAMRLLMLFLVVLGLAACDPTSTGDSKQATPTPSPTPSPTPIPSLDAGYRITAMRVAENNNEALDINGDGKVDNGMANALKELSSFLSARIRATLKTLSEEGTITQEQYLALSTATSAAISGLLSIQTVNRALEDAITADSWVQRTLSTGPGSVMVGYYIAEELEGGFLIETTLGEIPGTYTLANNLVDARPGSVDFTLVLVAAGIPEQIDFAFVLEDCRAVNTYGEAAILDGRLAGAISISEFEELVNDLLRILGLLPFLDQETVDELNDDLTDLLTEAADVELSSGEDAISISLFYAAEGVPVATGYDERSFR